MKNTTMNRRTFLKVSAVAGSGLLVGCTFSSPKLLSTPQASEAELGFWVRIDTDDTVTLILPASEMGQQAHTGQAMLVAEELEADWESIRVVTAPYHSEFINSGAAELAAELRAVSADHLMAVSDKGIRALAEKDVMATLLPGTPLFLSKGNYANGGKMIDSGCEVALATDYNPGSCTLQSMPFIISLANLYCGLNIEEAFKGATWNGAMALGLELNTGAVHEGYLADLLFRDIKSINEIPYWMGPDRILNVMKRGKLLE